MATPPRYIVPGQTVFVTGNAVDRQFRFAPSEETVSTIRYCLAEVASHFSIKLHAFMWLSNHYHLVLTDVAGELPTFIRELNTRISKALNAMRGTSGANFARESYNVVYPTDEDAILRHCAYTEANPCEADLVEYAKEWRGVSSVGMRFDEPQEVCRPKFGLWRRHEEEGGKKGSSWRPRGKLRSPAKVTLTLEPPPSESGRSPRSLRKDINVRVAHLERKAREARVRASKGVLGMEAAARQPCTVSPRHAPKPFTKIPVVSGSCPKLRKQMIDQLNAFLDAYKAALDEHKKTRNALFPRGTWWMCKHLLVRCATSPPA